MSVSTYAPDAVLAGYVLWSAGMFRRVAQLDAPTRDRLFFAWAIVALLVMGVHWMFIQWPPAWGTIPEWRITARALLAIAAAGLTAGTFYRYGARER